MLTLVAGGASCGMVDDARAPEGAAPLRASSTSTAPPVTGRVPGRSGARDRVGTGGVTQASGGAEAPPGDGGVSEPGGGPTMTVPQVPIGAPPAAVAPGGARPGSVDVRSSEFCEAGRAVIVLGDLILLPGGGTPRGAPVDEFVDAVERFAGSEPAELRGLLRPYRPLVDRVRAIRRLDPDSAAASLLAVRRAIAPADLSAFATIVSRWCDGFSDPVPISPI